jgi:hypothetical protein
MTVTRRRRAAPTEPACACDGRDRWCLLHFAELQGPARVNALRAAGVSVKPNYQARSG